MNKSVQEWKPWPIIEYKILISLLIGLFIFILIGIINDIIHHGIYSDRLSINLFYFGILFFLSIIIKTNINDLIIDREDMLYINSSKSYPDITREIMEKLIASNIAIKYENRKIQRVVFYIQKCIFLLPDESIKIIITELSFEKERIVEIGPQKKNNEDAIRSIMGLIEMSLDNE